MLALQDRSKDHAKPESRANKSNAATIHPINSRFEHRVAENSLFGADGARLISHHINDSRIRTPM